MSYVDTRLLADTRLARRPLTLMSLIATGCAQQHTLPVGGGAGPYRSSTSRIFRPSVSEVNGLCRNAIPGLRTPCWTMASSVYPDM